MKRAAAKRDSIIRHLRALMTREKIDLLSAVDHGAPNKVVGVLTSEDVANAYEKQRVSAEIAFAHSTVRTFS